MPDDLAERLYRHALDGLRRRFPYEDTELTEDAAVHAVLQLRAGLGPGADRIAHRLSRPGILRHYLSRENLELARLSEEEKRALQTLAEQTYFNPDDVAEDPVLLKFALVIARKHWVAVTAGNELVSLRRGRRAATVDIDELSEVIAVQSVSVDNDRMIEVALAPLSKKQRRALCMQAEGFLVKEIAEELRITTGGASKLLNVARTKSKAALFQREKGR